MDFNPIVNLLSWICSLLHVFCSYLKHPVRADGRAVALLPALLLQASSVTTITLTKIYTIIILTFSLIKVHLIILSSKVVFVDLFAVFFIKWRITATDPEIIKCCIAGSL